MKDQNQPIRTEESLCKEYDQWLKDNNFAPCSADELIHGDKLTHEQRHWLTAFILMWETFVENKQ